MVQVYRMMSLKDGVQNDESECKGVNMSVIRQGFGSEHLKLGSVKLFQDDSMQGFIREHQRDSSPTDRG
jgi:hypothetical protein